MKSPTYVMVLIVFVCGANSRVRRNLLVNDVKPFMDPNQREIQVPKTHVYSYPQPVRCSGLTNFVHCFKLNLLHNVSEILDGDDYWMTNSLVIEKLPVTGFNGRDDLRNLALKMQLKKYLALGKESNRMLLEGAMGIFRSHSLRWIVRPGLSLRILRNSDFGGKMDMAFELGEDIIATNTESSVAPRTFFRRKLQFALLSVMYKMGVMTTLLGALIVISLKTLAVGLVLLFLTGFNTIKAIGAKLSGLGLHGYHNNFHEHHPPEIFETGPPATQHKEVHVHIHNSGVGHGYGGSSGSVSLTGPSSGPGNHLYHGWSSAGSSAGSSGGGFSPYRRTLLETDQKQTGIMRDDDQVITI